MHSGNGRRRAGRTASARQRHPPSRILRDHGDSRFEQVREQEVVEADQRDLVMLSSCRSARIAPIVTRFWLAKSAVGGMSCRGSPWPRSRPGKWSADPDGPGAARRRCCARAGRRGPAVPSFLCGGDRRQVSEVADAAVPVREQVQDAIAGALTVVRQHHVRVEGQRRWAIDEDHTATRPAFGQEVALVVTGRHQDQAVDPTGDEGRRQLRLPSGSSSRLRRRPPPPRARDVLDRPMQRRREGVGDVLDEQVDRAGQSGRCCDGLLAPRLSRSPGGVRVAVASSGDTLGPARAKRS